MTSLRFRRGVPYAPMLFHLHIFMTASAVVGMVIALVGPGNGVPQSWLDGTPFGSYVIPGLILGVVVGGSQLLAAMLLRRRPMTGEGAAQSAAVILMGWIVVETAMIGLVSVLQPIVLAYAVVELWLATELTAHRRPPP